MHNDDDLDHIGQDLETIVNTVRGMIFQQFPVAVVSNEPGSNEPGSNVVKLPVKYDHWWISPNRPVFMKEFINKRIARKMIGGWWFEYQQRLEKKRQENQEKGKNNAGIRQFDRLSRR